MKSGQSWFNSTAQHHLDFAELDYLDPSLKEGHRVLYDKAISVHVKFQDRYSEVQEMTNPELLIFRVLLLGQDNHPQSVKIEISSDKDIFFIFHHDATHNTFQQIKTTQGLQMPYKDYASVIISSLNKIESNTNGYTACLAIMLDGSARLEVNQTTEFKSLNMINFDFVACDEQFLRQAVIFKSNQQRKLIKQLTQQLQDVKMKATNYK